MQSASEHEFQALDPFLGGLLWAQLQSIGLFREPRMQRQGLGERHGLRGFYLKWLEESIDILAGQDYLALEGDSIAVVDPAPRETACLWDEWERHKAAWLSDRDVEAHLRLVETTLRALPDILSGTRSATEVIFPRSSLELVEGIYQRNRLSDDFNDIVANAATAYVRARLDDDPSTRVRLFEIGAGTGGTSAAIFKRLAPYGAHVETYCYTDLSRSFLLHAEQEYGAMAPYLDCALFDAEQSPEEQGIPVGSYDVVVATNVLHATKNIRGTVRNAKALLKRNGVLILNENSTKSLLTHLTFGLLEGWWRYEDPALRIPGAPALYPQTWRRVLEGEGFRSIFFPAEEAHGLGQQIIVAESDGVVRRIPRRDAPSMPATRAREDEPARASDMRASSDLAGFARRLVRESVSAAVKLKDSQMRDEQSFVDYGVDSIVAVSLINAINGRCGIKLPTTALFDYNSIDRLARHLCDEHRDALLALQGASASATTARTSRNEPPPSAIDGAGAHLDRLDADAYYKVRLDGPGGIDDLRVVTEPAIALQPGQVRIAVHAFALNFADLLCVKGLYPNMPAYPFTPGIEVSGTVIEVGEEVRSLCPGDAVVAMMDAAFGGQAEMVVCAAEQAFKKPESLSFEAACALPVVALTMIDVFRCARPQKGERILIQTAAGGAGLIGVQLARYYGAEVYATAGSAEKLQYLAALGVRHGINYRERDFEAEIMRLTDGCGVDVVINTLPGDALQKGLNCLAPGGRYVELAMTALKSARSIDLSVLDSNQAFYSIDLFRLIRGNPAVLREYREELVRLVSEGVVTATVGDVFPLEQIKDAYRKLENRANIGKVVVRTRRAERTSVAAPAGVSAPVRGDFSKALVREAIAIVGFSARFPQSPDADTLWRHLAAGDDLIEEVTRWDLARHYAGQEARYCRHGGFLDDIDCFDAGFFNISAREAACMDPQQRLFLEEAWKALEHAGYAGAALDGRRCGVYVGCTSGDYAELFDGVLPPHAYWGNAASVVPSRIAYYLDLQGPAVAVDTACSSSLVAMHLACQSLWIRETDTALAGGVFVRCTPGFQLVANRAEMLSPTGRCRTFDASADGFVPGEGVAVVVLKRLSDALAARDTIHGVIRGSGINQDGTTNGITAPSAISQERLERAVYDEFGIHAEHIQLVEAHGTGTTLGDPIEYRALTRAFRKDTARNAFCAIGSIKTNLGHAVTAAGIAGVVKVLLALRHRQLPPSLHYREGNPHIDFDDSPFYVNTTLREWPAAADGERRAAVSSFGFSGTNAHMVIGEPPPMPRASHGKPAHLIVLSARTHERLRELGQRLRAHVESDPTFDCGNASFTLWVGRKHLQCRFACVASDRAELLQALVAWLANEPDQTVQVSSLDPSPSSDEAAHRQAVEASLAACRRCDDAERYRQALTALARHYVLGAVIEGQRLFESGSYARIPLPTHPLAKERHWLRARKPIEAPRDVATSNSSPPAASDGRHTVLLCPPDAVAGESTSPARARREPVWLEPLEDERLADPPVQQATTQSAPASIDGETLVHELAQTLADALYVSPESIDLDKPFSELGLDSVIGVEWVQTLNARYGSSLVATKLYEHPTVRQLASFVAAQCAALTQSSASAEPVLSESVCDVLRRVHDGSLDAAAAERLLHEYAADLVADGGEER